MNKAVEEITEENAKIRCQYCDKSTINSLEWGPMYSYEGVTVHYFCMLFSAGLSQNGDDEDGILGFLPKDIQKELRRGDKLRCKFCKKTRATIGCSVKTCKASYHYPCGLQEKSIFQFIGNFESYCSRHKEEVRIPLPREDWECPICFVNVEDDELPLWPPCCKKRVFHKRCIMEMAKNHGAHFFKCPLCNDKESFSVAMRKSGVYLPDRDATWETGNAFEDHLRLYARCDASECICPKGRDYCSQSDSKPWKIVRCGACGAAGTHKACGNLINLTWRCETCSRILSDKRKSDADFNSSRIQRHHFDTSSDEEMERSPAARINDAIIPSPPVSSESSNDIESESITKVQSMARAANQFPFFEKNRPNIVLVDDEDDSQSCSSGNDDNEEASSGSDSESDESEDDAVFISAEAKERLKQRFQLQSLTDSTKLRLSKDLTAQPTCAVLSDDVTNPPSFPPVGKDSLVKNRVEMKPPTVHAQPPEIIGESENCAKVKISLQGVSGVSEPEPSPTSHSNSDQDQDIIEIGEDPDQCPPFMDSKEKDLEAEDSGSDIEVISEKVVPVAQTKSSVLQEILTLNRGQGIVRKPMKPPIVRSQTTMSSAFLQVIAEVKQNKIVDFSQNQAVEVEVVNLDSDEDETASGKILDSGNGAIDADDTNCNKRDRLDSPGPSNLTHASKRSRIQDISGNE